MTRPTIDSIWGSTGLAVDPGSAEINNGWAAEIPPFETQNFWQKRVDELLQNIEQKGIMEWSTDTTYGIGSWVFASDNDIYKSLTSANTGNDPVSSPTNWKAFNDVVAVPDAAEGTKGIAELATTPETQAGANDTKIVTPLKLKDSILQVLQDGTTSQKGKVQLATSGETQTGTNNTKAVTPAGLATVLIPSGTRMLFHQTAAPTGWTKDVSLNDKSLRVVSGTVGSGGSVPFSTVFGKTATDSHTLTVAQMPSHKHDIQAYGSDGFNRVETASTAGGPYTITNAIQNTGGGGGHSHNMDIRVQYVDVIIAVKD